MVERAHRARVLVDWGRSCRDLRLVGMVGQTVEIPFVPLPKDPGRHLMTLPPVPITVARANGQVMTGLLLSASCRCQRNQPQTPMTA